MSNLYIFNTCHFDEHSEEKSALRQAKDFYPTGTMPLSLACACGKVQAK